VKYKMVGIINYDAGNVFSVYSAVKMCGFTPFIIEKAEEIKRSEVIIIPGVGSFDDGMKFLLKTGVGEEIKREIQKGKLFLGICLGLQLLFSESEEGKLKGLGILDGKVKKFLFRDNSIKTPHMGWSKVKQVKESNFFTNIPDNTYFYFAHSYYAKIEEENIIYGKTNYGINFPSVIVKNNIVGVQFHPEKSGKYGLAFLKNFLLTKPGLG